MNDSDEPIDDDKEDVASEIDMAMKLETNLVEGDESDVAVQI